MHAIILTAILATAQSFEIPPELRKPKPTTAKPATAKPAAPAITAATADTKSMTAVERAIEEQRHQRAKLLEWGRIADQRRVAHIRSAMMTQAQRQFAAKVARQPESLTPAERARARAMGLLTGPPSHRVKRRGSS